MDTTTDVDRLDILQATLDRIDARLARLEDTLLAYTPLLQEVTRRMAGPMSFRRKQG